MYCSQFYKLEAQDQKVNSFGVWWEPNVLGHRCHLYTSSSRGGEGAPWDLFYKVLISFMRALPSWPSHLPKASPPSVITSRTEEREDFNTGTLTRQKHSNRCSVFKHAGKGCPDFHTVQKGLEVPERIRKSRRDHAEHVTMPLGTDNTELGGREHLSRQCWRVTLRTTRGPLRGLRIMGALRESSPQKWWQPLLLFQPGKK